MQPGTPPGAVPPAVWDPDIRGSRTGRSVDPQVLVGGASDGSETIKAKVVQGRPKDSVQFSSLMSKSKFMWFHHPAPPPVPFSSSHRPPPLPPQGLLQDLAVPSTEAPVVPRPRIRHHQPGPERRCFRPPGSVASSSQAGSSFLILLTPKALWKNPP